MRFLLSFLLSAVLLQSQVWALSGGPVYTTPSGSETINGTYSGVLIPTIDDDVTEALMEAGIRPAGNSIGLFSLTVPESGLATGTSAIFVNGRVFTGTISGFADPRSRRISGLIDATTTFSLFVPADPTTTPPTPASTRSITAAARGALEARVAPAIVGSAGTPTAARLTGSSNLDISSGLVDANLNVVVNQTVQFTVVGVQQAIPAVVATDPTTGLPVTATP